MPSRLLTPMEVAAVLRVSHRTVVRWLQQGRLRGIRVGRQWRIPEEELQAILAPLYGEGAKEERRGT